MVTKVFVTGATGYIGGDGLYALTQAHPDWEFSALVRPGSKADQVAAAYPNLKLIFGTLEDADKIEKAAAEADIVLHTADSSDHEVSARAIYRGLKAGHSLTRPGYWIHVSGTGILCWYDMDNKRYGQPPLPDQAYDDWDGVDRLLNLPDTAFHRDIDKIVLEAAGSQDSKEAVKVALVCPPTIYGPGRGPVNQRSRQVPGLVESTLKLGYAPKIGTGRTEWDNVHVQDLSRVFELLAADAAAEKKRENPAEAWGPEAYYLVENGTHAWGDVADWVADVAAEKGLIPNKVTKSFDAEEAERMLGFQGVSWGLNSKGKARRARKVLGWEPVGVSLRETIPELVDFEAAALKK